MMRTTRPLDGVISAIRAAKRIAELEELADEVLR